MTPKYFIIEELINFIDEKNRALFEKVRGSKHNHPTWIAV